MTRRGGGGNQGRRGTAVVGMMAAVAAAATAGVAAARAEGVGPEPGAALDVIDLPALGELSEATVDSAALLAAVVASEDVVTGAAKREQSLGNVASAVTVISGDRLRRMGARTVGEAIATAAGLHLVDDRLSTRVNIRGIQPLGDFNTRILVIIDGTSVTENWSHLSGVGYDVAVSIDEVERIEVIRGPVSSIYGTNAFFGIINIITRGPSVDGRAWGRVTGGTISGASAAAGFAVGTVDEQLRGEVSLNKRLGERLKYDFGETTQGAWGRGERYLDRSSDAGAQLQASLSGSYHGTFAQVRGYIYDRTIPFGPYDSLVDDPYTQSNRQILADVGHVIDRGALQLSGRLFGGLYRFSDLATSTDAGVTVIGTARTVGAELRSRYQVLEELLGVTAGVEAAYNDTTSEVEDDESNKLTGGGDLPFGAVGLYLEADSAPTGWLTLTAGLRADVSSEFGGGRPAPRLAAFFSRGNRYGAKLLYAEGFRYPSTYESKFYDEVDFIDNPALKSERIRSAETIAWARPTPSTWLRASAFYWDAINIIKQKPVGAKLQFQNIASYTSLGLEVEASYRDRLGWLAFAGAALTQVTEFDKDDAGNKVEGRLAGSPTATASLGISSPLIAEAFHVSSELMLISSRGTANKTEAKPFAGWNLALYAPSLRGFDVTVGLRNVIGRRQGVPAAEDFERMNRSADEVPGEGRELYVRIGHSLY